MSRIVDASWSCIGQEDELIDLSDFSPTLFPTILWLSVVSYGVRSGSAAAVGETSAFALTFSTCSGETIKSPTKTSGSRGGYYLKAGKKKCNKLYLVQLLCR